MAEDVPAIGRDDILGTTSQAKTDNPKREGLSTIPQTDDSFRLELVIGLLCMSVAFLIAFFACGAGDTRREMKYTGAVLERKMRSASTVVLQQSPTA